MTKIQFIPNPIALKWKYDRQSICQERVMTIMRHLDKQLKKLDDSICTGIDSMEAIGIDDSDGQLYKITVKREILNNKL
ncbi:hypothetical protein [Adhaeribacter terreus]|uniref:Uncharacterized protein n=1 Tax=Adhaeribacter terreus TaxID=529703 RepID=A0ABW0EFH6_9BACT